MRIGVPRERKLLEKRVAITPEGVTELRDAGHQVSIERGAGEGSFISDAWYQDAGATIVDSLSEVWSNELVVKVKEPCEEEYKYLRKDLVVFTYLHLAGLPDVARAMIDSGVTGIAYELVQLEDRRLPLLEPMSEVAGKLAIINGANLLLSQNGGRGVLLTGTQKVDPATVVVIGFGVAGRAAVTEAVGMGAEVVILDVNQDKLRYAKELLGSSVTTLEASPENMKKATARADLLVGAVLVPGGAAPRVITAEMIEGMKIGSVFVDISIDQGGCSETTRVTSLAKPTYVENGVIHYAVPNMPAQTPRTSTFALTTETRPYLRRLADKGWKEAAKTDAALRKAINVFDGKITCEATAKALGKSFQDISAYL